MTGKTIRDLFGEPKGWANHFLDGEAGKPDMDGATIVDVFVSGEQIAIYTKSQQGVDALSLFFVRDPETRARIAQALVPGLNVNEAVSISI
jgi:hypothetical protein